MAPDAKRASGVSPGSHRAARGERSADRVSVVELLLPDGYARRAVVLGAPTGLVSETEAPAADERVDLVVARAREGELESLVAQATEKVDADGLVYLVVPGRDRRKARSALVGAGLIAGPEFVHVPDPEHVRLLVALEPASLQLAAERLGRRTWKWNVARVAARIRLGSLVFGGHMVGVVGRRSTAKPLFGWLAELGYELDSAVIQRSGGTGDLVVYALTADVPNPTVVAKVSPVAERLEHESGALETLAKAARSAGAEVPRPLGRSVLGSGTSVVLQTPVAGRVLAEHVAGRPARFERALERIAAWLLEWQQSSARGAALAPRIEEVLAAATTVAAMLDSGEEYLGRVRALAARVEAAIPLVAAHQDLTAINVLDDDGRLGIVDWEHARADGLPLTDLLYAAADLSAAVGRYADRRGAFLDCFSEDGRWRSLLAHAERRVARGLGFSEEAADLCFHACWAHHAANELRASGGEPGEFVELARLAAEIR